ncbi:NUDIX domain-containing protein [Pleomorphomonas sp. PLEO]|uniref:NUDIX hydrolase n=1 Tax=Pleomorphomonas sp. PLEO TaxID=3239306 RepID=UPI00351E3036
MWRRLFRPEVPYCRDRRETASGQRAKYIARLRICGSLAERAQSGHHVLHAAGSNDEGTSIFDQRKGLGVQQRVAVKAVIIDNDKCLLVKKEASQADKQFSLWEIPGGKVEIGEPLIEALCREVREELGIEVKVYQPLAAWDFIQSEDVQLIGITFLAEPLSVDIKLSPEHTDYLWLGETDLDSVELHAPVRAEILGGFQAIKTKH